MEDTFYRTHHISKSDLTLMMKRSDTPAIQRFLIMTAVLVLTGWAAVVSWNAPLWQVLLSQLAFGVMCCSTFACEHETIHGTAFKSRRWNTWVAFFCGIFHVYPSVAFRELHFTHHRYTHIPGKDPEISFGNYPLPSVVTTLPTYLAWLTGLPFLMFKVMMTIVGALGMPEFIRKMVYPFIRPQVRVKLFLNCWVLILVYGGIIYLAMNVDSSYWALIVGQIVGHSLLASYVSAEHLGLPHEGDILEKTRSIKAPRFVKLLMWNMTYHAEHHAYPAVPFHALPDLHEALYDELINKKENHPRFHAGVLSRLFD